jgi:hypothetical protein
MAAGGAVKRKNWLPRKFIASQKFGKLTALPIWREDVHGNVSWLCQCDCPSKTEKWMAAPSLIGGGAKSCGCQPMRPKKPVVVEEPDEEAEPLDRLEMLEARLRERFQLSWTDTKRGRWYGVFDCEHNSTELCGETKRAAMDRIEAIIAEHLYHAALPAFCRAG